MTPKVPEIWLKTITQSVRYIFKSTVQFFANKTKLISFYKIGTEDLQKILAKNKIIGIKPTVTGLIF